jgi:hypothetical protein
MARICLFSSTFFKSISWDSPFKSVFFLLRHTYNLWLSNLNLKCRSSVRFLQRLCSVEGSANYFNLVRFVIFTFFVWFQLPVCWPYRGGHLHGWSGITFVFLCYLTFSLSGKRAHGLSFQKNSIEQIGTVRSRIVQDRTLRRRSSDIDWPSFSRLYWYISRLDLKL